jgi:putative peptidoglycan binding protein
LSLSYQRNGLVMRAGAANPPELVMDLQRDLRALGYFPRDIDGDFGPVTTRSIMALQFDLLHNDGSPLRDHADGRAPVAIRDYNRTRVSNVSGELDQNLADCIADLLYDDRFPKLPQSSHADTDNSRALRTAAQIVSSDAPAPFVLAIMKQESQLCHYNVRDGFLTLGLDHNDPNEPARITSRGYGIGQYTLFHHPATAAEMRELGDPGGNVLCAQKALAEKWKAVQSEPERSAEHPALGFPRQCRYRASDTQRRLRACRDCALNVRRINIVQGQPFFPASQDGYQPDSDHPVINYTGVPDRADFLCDWAYAVRRYNGAGNRAYLYQVSVLLNLLNGAGYQE